MWTGKCFWRVFSAHAEVVPLGEKAREHYRRILRARGGSSMGIQAFDADGKYSPRTRR